MLWPNFVETLLNVRNEKEFRLQEKVMRTMGNRGRGGGDNIQVCRQRLLPVYYYSVGAIATFELPPPLFLICNMKKGWSFQSKVHY